MFKSWVVLCQARQHLREVSANQLIKQIFLARPPGCHAMFIEQGSGGAGLFQLVR